MSADREDAGALAEREDEAFLYLLSYTQEGMSDRDLAVELLHFLCLRGAKEPLVYPRVRLEGSDLPWPESGEEAVLRRNQAVEVRFGAPSAPTFIRHFVFGRAPSQDLVDLHRRLSEEHHLAVQGAAEGVVVTRQSSWCLADRVKSGRSLHRFDSRLLAIG